MLPPDYELQEFRIVRTLGEGGFGITYLAWDNVLDGPVAIKEYYPSQFANRPDGITVAPRNAESEALYKWGYDKFYEEAQLLSKLRHNNIVSVRRVLKANETLYLVMEFLEGEPLSSFIEKEGRIPEGEWMSWFHALCDGLKQLHRLDILHRDIKPDNIMICADAEGKALPVFIDFGAARPSTVGTNKAVTIIGTPGYAPIEQQTEDNRPQGPFTDIYALACTSFEALTGKRPDDALKKRILDDTVPELLEAHRGIVTDRVLDALAWGLQLHGHDRPQTLDEWLPAFQSAGAQAQDIKTVQDQAAQPTPAQESRPSGSGSVKPPPVPLDGRGSKSNKGLGVFVGVGVLLAAGAGFFYLNPDVLKRQPDQSEQRVEACQSIVLANNPLASIRCYRAILDDHPDATDARQGEINGLEHLFQKAGQQSTAGAFDQALATLDDLKRLNADAERIEKMRQEMLGSIIAGAERAIRQSDMSKAREQIAELERLGGDAQEISRLRDEIAAIELAEEQTRTAFARCQRQRQNRQFKAAHACYDALVAEYPQARRERDRVEAELKAHIEMLLNQNQLDAVPQPIADARDIGLAIADFEARLKTAREKLAAEQLAARRQAAAAEAQRKRDDAVRADRARPTYGFAIQGSFADSSRGTVFNVQQVSAELARTIPLARGDAIERIDSRPLGDIEAVRAQIKNRVSYVEDFSAGVPDSRVIEELVLRKLDVDRGQVKMRVRRNGSPESIFCKTNSTSIQCSGN